MQNKGFLLLAALVSFALIGCGGGSSSSAGGSKAATRQRVIATPQWANGKPNTYPAVFHVNFSITAGASAARSAAAEGEL